ncbi:MAG: Ig-like domain-containing protein [Bacteroidales bacterium]|nr:Ig-like domain-containing protein [Bacteroidales bacterium]
MVKGFRHLAKAIIVSVLVTSCASMGNPGGGPRDEMPPVFVGSTPAPGELNFNKKKIEIVFDENITLSKPQEKVVISPPQKSMPVIRGGGKRIFVEMKDSLQKNTTYTIDFSDAISDLNEKNLLSDFALSFSTGSYVDSLMVSGTLINAENHELIQNMIVGVQRAGADSLFETEPLLRICKTNSKGQFSVRNIAPGSYKIFALNDKDRNYYYSQPGEEIAFCDSLVVPSFAPEMRADTIWKDSITIDTVKMVPFTHFYPDDIVLSLFQKEYARQYLVKSERLQKEKFSLYMATKSDSLPVLKLLNKEIGEDWLIAEHSAHKDTIDYWIKDKELYSIDTLIISATYLKTDSTDQLSFVTDTLKIINKGKKKEELKKAEQKKQKELAERRKKQGKEVKEGPQIEYLLFKENISSSMDVFAPFYIEFQEPLLAFEKSGIHLKIKQDTIWKEVPFEIRPDSLSRRKYNISVAWKPGAEYTFVTDSAIFKGLYGLTSDYYERPFRVKGMDSYSSITFYVKGIKDPSFVQILSNQDAPLKDIPVVNGVAEYTYLSPGEYYARLIVDRNKNGKWDAGSYQDKIQPEEVFYFPKKFNVKVNWNIEEDWDPYSVPLLLQKPDKLRKVSRFDLDKTKKGKENEESDMFEFESMGEGDY